MRRIFFHSALFNTYFLLLRNEVKFLRIKVLKVLSVLVRNNTKVSSWAFCRITTSFEIAAGWRLTKDGVINKIG